jgi:hypothetical protein
MKADVSDSWFAATKHHCSLTMVDGQTVKANVSHSQFAATKHHCSLTSAARMVEWVDNDKRFIHVASCCNK